MGVTYKLTEDVVQFILAQKQASPDLSCRELVEQVGAQFHKIVSKSSVHDVLKEANITSPRGRKFKNKFQIPAEKKAQLLANLPSVMLPAVRPVEPVAPPLVLPAEPIALPPEPEPILMPAPEPPPPEPEPSELEAPEPEPEMPAPSLRPDPVAQPIAQEPAAVEPLPPEPVPAEPAARRTGNVTEILPPLEEGEPQEGMGEIFLKAAFADLFPGQGTVSYNNYKSIDIRDLHKEWNYRNLLVGSFKMSLQDGSIFYVDCRFQTVSRQLNQSANRAAPVERALADLSAGILNNIQPIVIKEVTLEEGSFADLWAAAYGREGKKIASVSLLTLQGQSVADFAGIFAQNRQFIAGVSLQIVEVQGLTDYKAGDVQVVPSYFYSLPLRFIPKEFFWAGTACRAFVVVDEQNKPQKAMLSNMPASVGDGAIVRAFAQRHPFPGAAADLGAPDAVAATDFLGGLKDYARRFFPVGLSDGDRAAALAMPGFQQQGSDGICITTLIVPDGAGQRPGLEQAAAAVNALALRDEHARQIFIKLQ